MLFFGDEPTIDLIANAPDATHASREGHRGSITRGLHQWAGDRGRYPRCGVAECRSGVG